MNDELKILITGDTAGIESAMKAALNIVQGGVKAMNDQTVDWTSIFSRAVSPAIIAGVASTFAFAIANAVNFQTAMSQTGVAAGDSSSQIAALSTSALNLSTTVPASAESIAQAMATVSQVFSNTADQQTIVTAAAQLSAEGFGSLGDIVTAATNIFQQFGVTTAAQGVTVLNNLMNAASEAKETIPDLASNFSDFSNQLPAVDKSVTTFTGLISNFSAEVAAIGQTGASQIFSALGSAATGANPALDALGGGLTNITKSIQSNGGVTAIAAFSDKMKDMGSDAALIATNMGLSATQVEQFQVNSEKLPQIAAAMKAVADSTKTAANQFPLVDNGSNSLLIDWNKLKASFLDSTFWNAMASNFLKLAGGITNTIVGLNKGLDDWISTATSPNGLTNADPISALNANLANPAFKIPGGGYSQNQYTAIDNAATSSGLVQALTSALQSGLTKGSPYGATLNTTFNLSSTSGSPTMSAQQIAQKLYTLFNGQA